MRKSFIFILILLIFPLVSAVQINMDSNFSQGETLMAQVSGNFLTQIQQQNVLLYNGHVRVSFIPYVQEMGGIFYIYGQLSGKSPGNYSLVISGASYVMSGSTSNEDVPQNFTITNNSADFSISPGFVESGGGNFSISAYNFLDTPITVNSFLENTSASSNSNSEGFLASLFGGSSSSPQITSTTSTTINSGQTVQIPFSVNSSAQNQLIYAVLETGNTTYQIPVFIISNSTLPPQQVFQYLLSFQPSQELFSMATSSNTSSNLSLYNSGPMQIVNLSVSSNLQPYVSIPNQSTVNANSTTYIPINITAGSASNLINGQITASSSNSTAYFALILNFSSSYVGPTNVTLFQTCSQLNGTFCNSSATCSVSTQQAEDGACCVGICQPIQSNSSGVIIGWTIVAIVIVFVVIFIVRRYKKANRPLNLLNPSSKR